MHSRIRWGCTTDFSSVLEIHCLGSKGVPGVKKAFFEGAQFCRFELQALPMVNQNTRSGPLGCISPVLCTAILAVGRIWFSGLP